MSKTLGQKLFEARYKWMQSQNLVPPYQWKHWNHQTTVAQEDWKKYAKTPDGRADMKKYIMPKPPIRYLNRPNKEMNAT